MSATEKSCLYQRGACMYISPTRTRQGRRTAAYCSVSDVVYTYVQIILAVCGSEAALAYKHTRAQRNSHAAAQFCLKLDLWLQLIHNHYSNNFSPKRKQYARALIRRHNLWPLFIICILNMRARASALPTTITLLLTAIRTRNKKRREKEIRWRIAIIMGACECVYVFRIPPLD
jgi:hypothetical protein